MVKPYPGPGYPGPGVLEPYNDSWQGDQNNKIAYLNVVEWLDGQRRKLEDVYMKVVCGIL